MNLNAPIMRALRPALLWLVVFSAACSDRAGDAGGGETGGTVVIVTPGTGSSPMLPPLAVDVVGRLIADNVYERLAEIGSDMNAVGDRGFTPRLARSWEWAADSLSIAFAMDPRARWHDGRPVRASDVRYTLALLKDPKAATQYTSLLENVDSISVRDSLTAVAWFRKRTPEQFYDVAHQVYVLPEHALKDIPSDQLAASEAATRPMGSGRFRLARFEPGVRVELLADTSHYRGRPKLDRVIVSFVADPGAAVTQLFSGQGDWFENIPPDVLPRVDSTAPFRAVPYPGLQYVYMGMNQRDPKRVAAPHPILADRRVRLAISMALDREAMLQNVFGKFGVPGAGPYSRALADPTIAPPPFDRARAAALLDSAGWRAGADGVRAKNGRPLRLGILVPTSSQTRMRYGVLIQERGEQTMASVRLLEGWTFHQFRAELAMADALKPTTAMMTDNEIMDRLGAAGVAPEGRFFPDTYNYSRGSRDFAVLEQAYRAMQSRLEAAWNERDPDTPLRSANDALILASIVEKETGAAAERGYVASVFVNRLRIGMPLQTDPTVIYGLGNRFDGNSRTRDLLADTPYNTYTRTGLPPTPISMPGNDSLLAAVRPERTKALYFVSRGDGSSQFSETLAEHNRAVDKYQRRK